MCKSIRRFVALFLMAWLHFFSTGALAMAACPHMTSHDDSGTMEASPSSMHAMPADHDAGHPVQHGAQDCNHCGPCHLGNVPGLVSVTADFILPVARTYSLPPATHFLSITLPIFDPPPLARV